MRVPAPFKYYLQSPSWTIFGPNYSKITAITIVQRVSTL
jgi:hypothetical protein